VKRHNFAGCHLEYLQRYLRREWLEIRGREDRDSGGFRLRSLLSRTINSRKSLSKPAANVFQYRAEFIAMSKADAGEN
jgi:hypothetical protein